LTTTETSVFDTRRLGDIYEEIRQVYLSDTRPWIIGYSGGKDSTAALQLVWNALADLPSGKRSKPVYVIASDTLVETPVIVDYIDTTLSRVNETAQAKQMPFSAVKVQPQVSQTFWVNLIGRGYPAPQQQFRWCTDRMKIKPADRFIREKVSQHGEVIVVLGVRRSESMTRAQVMSLHEIKGSILSRHTRFSGAFVYTPIRDFSLDDVWSYLLQTPCPWGNNNRDLVALYRTANSGECPLVVDDTTPSCGNSRFGCWVCTVVSQDKTMEALIDSGEEWMEPLLEVRNLLASTQDPEVKPKYREYKRRTGFVSFNRNNGKMVPGPYKLEFCREVLRKLLHAQLQVRKSGPDPSAELIGHEELFEIRRIWRTERGDWQDSVPEIYKDVVGNDLIWTRDDIGPFGGPELALLEKICNERKIPHMLLVKLISAELSAQGMSRRSSVYSKIERILGEEWRTAEEIVAQLPPAKN
jgi:DNA sulfur modification protein DndC